ncbi:MAG: GAF domain-containing protein [Chloroflexi bacterium]|nr:GAF domain-containing protein [Chloroflexota bacterium]
MVPLLVALGFWAVGLAVWLGAERAMSLAFFALVADILAVGMLSGTGAAGDEIAQNFQILLALAIPITWHFHHSLLDRPPRHVGRFVSAVLIILAIVVSSHFLLGRGVPQDEDTFVILRSSIRLSLVSAWALGWLLLFANYRLASRLVQGRIRLMTFGTLFAFAPLVFLSLLPETSGLQYFVPYELTIPWLLLSPLFYAYSLFRRRLVRSEIALNRAGVYYLLIIVLLTVYMALAAFLSRVATSWGGQWFIVGGFLSVVLLLLFAPIKRAFEKLMVWILYGGEVTYTSVIGRLSESLSTTLDRELLLNLLTAGLPSVMRLNKISLFLRGDSGTLAPVHTDRFMNQLPSIPGDGSIAAYLMKGGPPLRHARVRRAVAGGPLTTEEQALLSTRGIAYWLPLISGETLHGLLLIGHKSEDEPFTTEDEKILATLSRQAGIAIHNVRLVEEVRAGQQELARAHQQLLARGEYERREIALELHDRAVQQLLGISYQVYEQEGAANSLAAPGTSSTVAVSVQTLETIRGGIVDVVRQLRRLISELRPPELEDMGLAAAIEGYVGRLEQEGGDQLPDIELDLDPNDPELSDSAKTCLFRATQEALRNALRHAAPEHIRVSLHVLSETAELLVEDDGAGFRVPARLSELASRDHFGLTGTAERVAWAGGQLDIRSKTGSGTTVRICVPLKQKEIDHGSEDTRASGR